MLAGLFVQSRVKRAAPPILRQTGVNKPPAGEAIDVSVKFIGHPGRVQVRFAVTGTTRSEGLDVSGAHQPHT